MNFVIDEQKIIKLFIEIASISSPSFCEQPVFDFITAYLQGKKVTITKIPYYDQIKQKSSENMIIRLPAKDISKKGLFFDAHADTVSPCSDIVPIFDGDIIKSSGNSILGADDKSGIASMLTALDIILENDILHGELLFIISSAEEIGLIGARYIPEEEFKDISFGVILDSSGPVGAINLQAPYHYTYTITIKGRASHAGLEPEKGINAIKIAADIIQELPSGRISQDTVCNIGVINGGTGRNIVPELVTIIGEVRSLIHEKCQPVIDEIYRAVETHKVKAVSVDCFMELSTVGYSFDTSSPIVSFISEGLKEIGIEPRHESSCGATNANVYFAKGIPSTVISVGMQEIHTLKEYIKVSDLINTTKLILTLVQKA